jgi:phage protein U
MWSGVDMTNKEIIELVADFPAWQGNTYALAVLIAQRQREDDAVLAEGMGQQEVADSIRASC